MFISFFGKYPDNLDPYSAALGDQGDFTEEPERIEDIAGEANKLADTLRSEFIESTSLLEQYQLLCKAEEQIGGLGRASLRQHEQVTPDSGLSLFNTLQTIQSSTESTFLKRMALNNTMLWVHYMGRQWYKDGGLSQQAQALQAQHPDIKPLFDFGSHIYGRYDDFGDVEAMPPDMFFDTAQNEDQPVYSAEEDPDHELESILSIQTASVFGVHVHKLSLPARKRLFEFGLSLDDVDIKRISTVRESFDEMVRLQFAEAFLATEFGDDFGDILLDLAEKADSSELHRAVELIADVRKAGREIAEQFVSEEPLDRLIAERMPTAFAKRVTELLALARQDGISEVMESLEAVAGASGEIAKSLASGVFTQVDMAADFGSFGAEGAPVTITARPSGNNARLGFTVRGMGASGKERLNIRLDYEDGRLSLDIGSGAKKGVNSSDIARKVGADLARGELALAIYRDTESALHGNHIREMFEDLPDIYPDEFAGVVNRFMYRLKLSGPTDLQKAA